MAFKNINIHPAVTSTDTPVKLFDPSSITRTGYRCSVTPTATEAVLFLALPAGSPDPTQAEMLESFDWLVNPGATVEDAMNGNYDIWVCSVTTEAITITGKEILA